MMAPRAEHAAAVPVWAIWIMLVGASAVGFELAEGHATARTAATVAVGLAALKIHLVFDHYMELKWTHRPLRPMLAAWLALVSATLLASIWLT
ncbi:cytochrome C oxidase subunit IV family protein [Novosphingobium lentum]|uniref:cytochrome C oxidase subunit IV family protein n=1 Tax=Novosphingobium lentum TaxID=145287 RepID=UPI00082D7375|nr:cytochrome C oxidase subunit IV family protein [Novosphingobium lentum]